MQQTLCALPLYALLVGINHYRSPNVPDLGGCVNDVEAMAELLQTQFDVPPTQIATLLNEQATYDAVKSQFRQHLIEPVRRLVEQSSADQRAHAPAVLFHFSGHGSQAPDPTGQEPDGFDETLVCHDSRLPDIYDLKDWELGELLDELAQYTDNITVILDCCHSGSGTRADAKLIVHTRSCSRDLRPQQAHRPLPATGTTSPIFRRSAAINGAADNQHHWARGRSTHVLLAACRDQEKALEYIPPLASDPSSAEQSAPSTAQRRHGVLTHYLIPLLEKLDAQQPPTYRELYEELRHAVTHKYPQTPQCEGDWGRLLFGGVRPDRDLWLSVVDQRAGLYWINGGLAHGLTEGMRFQVYRPGARTVADAGEGFALLEAVEIGAVQSGCTIISQTSQAQTIPIHSRLLQVDIGQAARRKIAIDVQSAMIATAIRERLAADDLAGLVALLPAQSDADLRLALVEDVLEVRDRSGTRIGDPYPLRQLNRMRRPLRAADLDPIAADLRRIVRAQRLDLLQNLESDLADALVMTVRRLDVVPTTGAVCAGRVIVGTAMAQRSTIDPVPSQRTADAVAPSLLQQEPFVVEISNRGEEPLYVGLLLRSGAWSVEQIYPEVRGAQEQLLPGRTVSVGLHENPLRQLRLALNNDTRAEEVTFLLIGTVAETEFEALVQQERVTAAKEYEHQARQAKQPVLRSFQMGGQATAADEWISLRLAVQVVAESMGLDPD